MTEKNRDYSNEEITIHWKPEKCIHSANCIRTLPGVFNPNERPWIKIKNADTPHLVEAVDKCPSGALSYSMNEAGDLETEQAEQASTLVNIFQDGPIEVRGEFTLTGTDGKATDKMDKVFLCRCGQSSKKPFCDGSHKKAGFRG